MIFNRSRFTTKLMVTYLLLTAIPIMILGYVSYVQYAKSVENQVGKYIPQLLDRSNINIDRQIQEYQNLLDLISNSDEVLSILRKESFQSQSQMLKDQFTVESNLINWYLSGNYKGVLGVFVVSKNRLFKATRFSYENFDYDPTQLPYGQDLDYRGEVQIFLPGDANLTFEKNIPYLLLVKQIKDLDNRINIGTIFLAVDLEFLKDNLDQLSEEDESEIWVMDENGQIIYHHDRSKIGTIFEEVKEYPIKNGSFKTRSESGGDLISISESELTGWLLTHKIEIEALTSEASQIRNIVITVFGVLFVASSFITIYLTWRFTRPINQLSRLMIDVEKGNFEVDLNIRSRDEVGLLARRFNIMVKEIRGLIREKYQMEIKQKEAELNALQFQINPHFMYNTLETISMSVEFDEKEQVIEMVTLLGRMLRYSLGNKQPVVLISDEVQHAEDFLKIQKFRFEDALEYEVYTQIELDQYLTPKFILQPILENAIKYGLEHRQHLCVEMYVVVVKAFKDGKDAIQFVIRDNGVGISEDRLHQVKQDLLDASVMDKDSGVGLGNVHARILLKFGEPYGVQIESEEGEGTTTTITIPMLTRNEGIE